MDNKDKIQYLIVDTTAFIKNAALQDVGVNILTEQAVVNEITSKRQLRRLVVLPYDLKVQEAFPENIQFVTEFSKKTGDYTSLSATDIKVIALTYQLEKEKVGTEHLKTAPIISKTIKSTADRQNEDDPKLPVGFYMSKEKRKLCDENNAEFSLNDVKKTDIKESIADMQIIENSDITNVIKQDEQPVLYVCNTSTNEMESDCEETLQNIESTTENLIQKVTKASHKLINLKIENEIEEECVVNDILGLNDMTKLDIEQSDIENEDNDDDGWITPGNIINVKKQMDSDILEEKAATVACLTMDFAMQNVLMQIGLNIAALDGRVIKQMRTFIFRCYACFKTTSIMTKVFCPHCGNKTLKKVEITLDENGKQQIHINFRKSLSAKGKKFSLPTPKGGKHANNPILYEDQPLPDQRSSRLARTKNNPLEDDYIAGYSPFIMRDVNSRSAMLGIKSGGTLKYWMKRNPNESRKKRK